MVMLAAAMVPMAGCGDDDDDDDVTGDDDDDTATPDDDDDDNDDDDAESICTEITYNLHASTTGWVFVNLTDMSVEFNEPAVYDFKVGHLADKAEDIDYFILGPNVEGINLGNDPMFDGVAQAPESGYQTDDPDYVIGTSWQSGGSCPAGWIMTDNVYALHMADGTYGKLAVTSAQEGNFTISVFRQTDGTRDMVCSWMK